MDTILQPRHFSSSSTSDSSSEDDKYSTSSSKVTVVPKEGLRDVHPPSSSSDNDTDLLDENKNEKLIICPTARFLQVNPRKVSSYDLLVLPPKRARFIAYPSRTFGKEDASNDGGVFIQKTNPFISKSISIKTPTLECIFFENEKLKCRNNSWSSSSSSASPRNANLWQPHPIVHALPPPPQPLTRIFSEEHTIRQIEEERLQGGSNEIFKNDLGENCSSKDFTKFHGNDFPTSRNYALYAHWTPSFHKIFMEYENERLRDENRNYLRNVLPNKLIAQQNVPPQSLGSLAEDLKQQRKIIKPVYRLKDVNANSYDDASVDGTESVHRPPTVYLKESDYDPTLELSLFLEDEQNRNKPPWKRRKVIDNPGECKSDEEENGSGPKSELIFCNETDLVNEHKKLGAGDSKIIDPEHVSSMFRTDSYHENSSEYYGTSVRIQTREEFTVIHHPDLRDLRSDSVTIEGMGLTYQKKSELEEEELNLDQEPPNLYPTQLSTDQIRQSPISIFLSESLPCPSSEFHFGADSFLQFQDDDDEESRIVDVTDLIGDDDELFDDNGTIRCEMETLFQAANTTNSTDELGKGSSGQCHLIEELLQNLRKEDSSESGETSTLDLNDIEPQEVLMQPKPQLKFSTSVHSTLERRLDDHNSTTHKFLENRGAKSDYFVGKVKGLSKSLMNYYQPQDNSDKEENEFDSSGYGEMINISSPEDSQYESPPSPELTEIENLQKPKEWSPVASRLEGIIRKISSPVGNRVSDMSSSSSIPNRELESVHPHGPIHSSALSTSGSQTKPEKLVLHKKLMRIDESSKRRTILKSDKKPNIFKRLICTLFGIRSPSKNKVGIKIKKTDDANEFTLSQVPPRVVEQNRRIIQHTDSKELYRQRRQQFFDEQKMFQNESLAAYLKSIPLQDVPMQSKQEDNNPPISSTQVPISYFLEKPTNYANRKWVDVDTDTVSVPVRLATSESAILDSHPGRGQARSRIFLRFPPIVHALAASLVRKWSQQDYNVKDFEKEKQNLRKPLKGILKKMPK